MSLINSYFN